ncbi:MAG: hypothetical protein HZA90_22910 [Verrucomicrobia bacterium]|nr:hypothetical protein [Verrucomicrobiota bacterium]
MNPNSLVKTASLALAALSTLISQLSTSLAATTITDTNHFAYGANVGWMDWRGDTSNGAVIGEFVCSGYLNAANVGWIHLGGNAPANGIRYQNNSGTDYGINHDGLGNLRGYAYGANIGWINFESTGAPRVDLATGRLSGYAYSANCGWISLSNAAAVVQTAFIAPGADSDGDGMADAWERTYTNSLSAFTASSDADQDGSTDRQEYLADTNPLDPSDHLRITRFTRLGTYNTLEWTSKPSRFYRVERRAAVDRGSPWETIISYDLPGWGNVGFNTTGPQFFYRIRATQPLSP